MPSPHLPVSTPLVRQAFQSASTPLFRPLPNLVRPWSPFRFHRVRPAKSPASSAALWRAATRPPPAQLPPPEPPPPGPRSWRNRRRSPGPSPPGPGLRLAPQAEPKPTPAAPRHRRQLETMPPAYSSRWLGSAWPVRSSLPFCRACRGAQLSIWLWWTGVIFRGAGDGKHGSGSIVFCSFWHILIGGDENWQQRYSLEI